MARPSKEFEAFVLDQLSDVPSLSSGPFFGGVGLRSDGRFFGMLMGSALYFSTSPSTREAYRRHESRPFAYAKGGKLQETKLFEVPASVLDDPEQLRDWALEAIAVAGQKPRAGTSRKRKRPAA